MVVTGRIVVKRLQELDYSHPQFISMSFANLKVRQDLSFLCLINVPF